MKISKEEKTSQLIFQKGKEESRVDGGDTKKPSLGVWCVLGNGFRAY